jgi:hypothetical protein
MKQWQMQEPIGVNYTLKSVRKMISLQMFDSDCLDCGVTDVLPTMKYAAQIIRAIGIGRKYISYTTIQTI